MTDNVVKIHSQQTINLVPFSSLKTHDVNYLFGTSVHTVILDMLGITCDNVVSKGLTKGLAYLGESSKSQEDISIALHHLGVEYGTVGYNIDVIGNYFELVREVVPTLEKQNFSLKNTSLEDAMFIDVFSTKDDVLDFDEDLTELQSYPAIMITSDERVFLISKVFCKDVIEQINEQGIEYKEELDATLKEFFVDYETLHLAGGVGKYEEEPEEECEEYLDPITERILQHIRASELGLIVSKFEMLIVDKRLYELSIDMSYAVIDEAPDEQEVRDMVNLWESMLTYLATVDLVADTAPVKVLSIQNSEDLMNYHVAIVLKKTGIYAGKILDKPGRL